MNLYPIRSVARLSVHFTNASHEPADPSTIELTIRPPNSAEIVTQDVTRDDTGAYHYDYTVSDIGVHRYKWQGDGDLIAANAEKVFRGIR